MPFLIDTNILLRSAEPSHPMYPIATNATSLEIYREWKRILIQYSIIGVSVHDARLVAAMLVHRLTHILTFNTDDFKRYTEIVAVNPSELSS
jgi:predicted nucleic acid-binding protein